MDPRVDRLKKWLNDIAEHKRKYKDERYKEHIIRISYNPRTKEHGASCAAPVCNKMFWIKRDDIPEEWQKDMEFADPDDSRIYAFLEKFLNQLEGPDEELAHLYEVKIVMES